MLLVSPKIDHLHVPIISLKDLEIYCKATLNKFTGLFVQRNSLRLKHEFLKENGSNYYPGVYQDSKARSNYPIYRASFTNAALETICSRDFLLSEMLGGTPKQTRDTLIPGAEILMRNAIRALEGAV